MVNLSILILNYNTQKLTIECLESIVKNYKDQFVEKSFEIILLDNNSKKETLGEIKKFLSSEKIVNLPIKIIESKNNLGFAKGNNIAANSARGKYLLFLNSDTEILDKGLLGMVDFFDMNEKVAILGGKLTNVDGSKQPSAGKFYTLGNVFLMLFGVEKFGFLRKSPNFISRVDWISGACMMIKREIFDEIKGFDNDFFMYVEDMDLCFRANKRGFLTYFFPDINVIHKNLGSSDKTYAILNIYKGLLIFYKKHKANQLLFLKSLLKMKSLLSILIGTLTRNNSLVDTYKKAVSTVI